MIINLINYLRDRWQTVTYCGYGLIALILVWSLTVDTSHAHTWAEMKIPGFWGLFGLGSCTVIILIAKWFGGSGIQTREDYYDK
ncbi:MAG: hypothetical protein H8E79_04120 [Desulfobulbaceae bacterium]|uniref:Uncharacterized protein n=1 Tax=Candidatus Desulfatifera sulfidica TaxID=2841691 RepID=A0A8J6N634_9BACT|nr:hypothetical protein [Candidatus Desulfatifera sulfidica]